MPYISWHPTRFLVFFSLIVGVLLRTTSDRTATTETTSFTRPLRRCPEPPELENGNYRYNGDKRSRGAFIVYYCNLGYSLIGPSVFYCSPIIGREEYDPSEGHKRPQLAWNPDFSKTRCEPNRRSSTTTEKHELVYHQSTCSLSPPKDRNIIVRDWRKDYPMNSGVVYSCQTGYVIDGPTVRWCYFNGRWSPEEEPKCIDKAVSLTTVPPTTTPAKNEPLTIMKIILYVSIPLLVVFVVAIACNMRRQYFKRNRRSLARSSSSGHGDARYPQLLPTRATGYADLIAHPYHPTTSQTAPLPHLLNSDEFTMPFTMTEDAPLPIMQGPPSYEEATRDSSLPSFEVAQKLYNSSTNVYQNSCENVH